MIYAGMECRAGLGLTGFTFPPALRCLRVPARGSVNPSPSGDGSLFLTPPSGMPWRSPEYLCPKPARKRRVREGINVRINLSLIPGDCSEGRREYRQSAVRPTLTGLHRYLKPSPLGGGRSPARMRRRDARHNGYGVNEKCRQSESPTRKGRDRVLIVKIPGLMGISVQANAWRAKDDQRCAGITIPSSVDMVRIYVTRLVCNDQKQKL